MENLPWIEIAGTVLLVIVTAAWSLERFAKFKYKKTVLRLIKYAKDGRVSEQEFQNLVDTVQHEHWGNSPLPDEL